MKGYFILGQDDEGVWHHRLVQSPDKKAIQKWWREMFSTPLLILEDKDFFEAVLYIQQGLYLAVDETGIVPVLAKDKKEAEYMTGRVIIDSAPMVHAAILLKQMTKGEIPFDEVIA